MKRLFLRAAAWLVVHVLMTNPRAFRACADLIMAVEGGLSPLAAVARVASDFIPGTADDDLIRELTETPARVWLRGRGGRVMLPTGRTIAETYDALKRRVTGRDEST